MGGLIEKGVKVEKIFACHRYLRSARVRYKVEPCQYQDVKFTRSKRVKYTGTVESGEEKKKKIK